MQIGAATQFANSGANTDTLRAGTASDQAEQDSLPSSDASTNSAASTSQDDAVQISPQGYAAASTGDTADSDAAAIGATSAAANAQPVKSLVYGALGLERPDAPADQNQSYTLGRWIAAGITLGGLISLLI